MCAEHTEKDTAKKEERCCIKGEREASVRKDQLMTKCKTGIDKQATGVHKSKGWERRVNKK